MAEEQKIRVFVTLRPEEDAPRKKSPMKLLWLEKRGVSGYGTANEARSTDGSAGSGAEQSAHMCVCVVPQTSTTSRGGSGPWAARLRSSKRWYELGVVCSN